MITHPVYVGTAAWNIAKEHKGAFETGRSQLENYASRLNGVEINSSFYRHHKAMTYARWAESVPEDFRFAVKLYRAFTHDRRLIVEEEELKIVLGDISHLGEKLGALLVQLPPSLSFEATTATRFFSILRSRFDKPVVFEPRHRSWVSSEALQVLKDFRISKVIADPEPCPAAHVLTTASAGGLVYVRLHGSPEIYKSLYEESFMKELEDNIGGISKKFPLWCIFDNTTFGHATRNALELSEKLLLADARKLPDPGKSLPRI